MCVLLILLQHMDESRMSSVICDERFDNAVIRVDKNGFHPSTLYIQKVYFYKLTTSLNLLILGLM